MKNKKIISLIAVVVLICGLIKPSTIVNANDNEEVKINLVSKWEYHNE